MEGYRRALPRSVLAGLVMLAGSSCAWLHPPREFPLPRRLPASPDLGQVIDAVNSNSSRIHSFSTDQARVSVPGIPSLSAAVAFERPKRLRLRAGTGVFGAELDVGSNDELFWIWITRQPPLYFCRHDQFAASPVRDLVPIEPQWLIEALGVSELDPALAQQGPIVRPDGRLEIHTIRQTAGGPMTKITVVDGVAGVILEQRLYDPQRCLVASAVASRHRRDPATGLIMPGVVEIDCPRAQFAMRLELGNVRINPPLADLAGLWTMPTFDGRPIDLGDPRLQLAPVCPTLSPQMPSPAASLPSVTVQAHRPRRGWNRLLR